MRVLSIVPNSAATERVFSHFGVVQTKVRNRLHPDKVRKTVLVRMDTATRFGVAPRRKRKFGDDSDGEDDDFQPIAASSNTSTTDASTASGMQGLSTLEDGSDRHVPSLDFAAFAQELIRDTEDNGLTQFENEGSRTTNWAPSASAAASESSAADNAPLLLANLFVYPDCDSGAASGTSVAFLTSFWRANMDGLDREMEFQDAMNIEHEEA